MEYVADAVGSEDPTPAVGPEGPTMEVAARCGEVVPPKPENQKKFFEAGLEDLQEQLRFLRMVHSGCLMGTPTLLKISSFARATHGMIIAKKLIQAEYFRSIYHLINLAK